MEEKEARAAPVAIPAGRMAIPAAAEEPVNPEKWCLKLDKETQETISGRV